MPDSLAIAQVTPHPVGSGTEVDRYVTRAATELAARGHRVLLVVNSQFDKQGPGQTPGPFTLSSVPLP